MAFCPIHSQKPLPPGCCVILNASFITFHTPADSTNGHSAHEYRHGRQTCMKPAADRTPRGLRAV
ncbi:conserved protein of unknown function [Ectopseudomonas oleovorans]|uniref:Uncharacterized protein n=1 Tax=Ectopseudomonas oleovorans TaxID=301 RepID=A0A653B3L2_ECTOL|nr:conserved protein of unknown function [Pseudomonas oleovorans]